jgi:formate dehydrogenase major subunit
MSTSKRDDYTELGLEVHPQKHAAAGPTAVAVSMKRALERMGPTRTARTLKDLNQKDGFDCPSCAWPDPDHRHTAEFCENGAKAVAEEATKDRATPQLFATYSIEELDAHSELWLGQQGRLTEPMVKRPGGTHYEPIDWDEAFALIGEELKALDSPDEATFYTSGRTSNEAAFTYQLVARAFGTNNLPDCSNMSHESTSVALKDAIGIGKASVTLEDLHVADLIVIAGQNPGTNHPRMLTALEIAKQNGAKIIAINPLREAGLTRFKNPQKPKGVVGNGTALADLHVPVRVNGDLALFQAIGALLLEWDALDHDFIATHTHGFEAWRDHLAKLDWDLVTSTTGLTVEQIREVAEMVRDSKGIVWCWAMGLTQHRNGVNTIRELANLTFARGDIGRTGAGLLPVRGHSNVQGDRSMGIWERPPHDFLDALDQEFGFASPRDHGHDVVDSIRAMRDGRVKVFIGLGGNFAQATPDSHVTEDALRNTRLTVQISTKLNRSHLVCGDTALILPTLGRTERDEQAAGPQTVTVEDSVCSVHASRGPLKPASPHLRSEVAIVTGIAEATLGDRHGIGWKGLRDDYSTIRGHISRVVAGCEDYEARSHRREGFLMPHPPRDSRTFPTDSGRAEFAVSPVDVLQVPEGHLLLQTLRSHDQFNTTIYGLSDRYRGIEGGRRVVFVNRDDAVALGLETGSLVDIVSVWEGTERRAPAFRVVEYDTPVGCAAAYYPETNPLVALDATADGSNTPAYKSVIVRLEPATDASP